MDKSILTDKLNILNYNLTPEYSQLYIHPEEGESFNINTKLNDIYYDINNINNTIVNIKDKVNTLINNTNIRLENINLNIINEKERLQDIKILCNKYTDFDKVILIDKDKAIYGDYMYNNNAFSLPINSFKELPLTLNNVLGNGEIGNEYIYKDGDYIKNTLNTDNKAALFDNSIATYWEYQRITASSTEKYLLNNFYMDNEEAKCTLTLESVEGINELIITTDIENIQITGIKCSNNNIDYVDLVIPNIYINTKLKCYDDYNYVYGSGVISIPNSKYVKITFQSNGTTNDIIAFDKSLFIDEVFDEEEVNDTYVETTIIKTGKRHLIKINDIKAYKNVYKRNGYIRTDEILKDSSIYSVGVFANVYIPEGLSNDCVEFILTVNGIDYKVVPINTIDDGIKIIRYSLGKSKTEYTQLTSEIINSVVLTVIIKGSTNLTPYINNIKILLGGDI